MTGDSGPCTTLGDPYWDAARACLTEKQLRLLELRDRHGMSLRGIALTCGLSVSTVRGQLERSDQKIELLLRQRKDAA